MCKVYPRHQPKRLLLKRLVVAVSGNTGTVHPHFILSVTPFTVLLSLLVPSFDIFISVDFGRLSSSTVALPAIVLPPVYLVKYKVGVYMS